MDAVIEYIFRYRFNFPDIALMAVASRMFLAGWYISSFCFLLAGAALIGVISKRVTKN